MAYHPFAGLPRSGETAITKELSNEPNVRSAPLFRFFCVGLGVGRERGGVRYVERESVGSREERCGERCERSRTAERGHDTRKRLWPCILVRLTIP